MKIYKRDFPEIMLDNDETYIAHLCGVVDSVDELCSMEIVRKPLCYHFRIAPSLPVYLEPLLTEILKFNNLFGIHLSLSKSMKASSTITFDINLQ